MKSQCAHSSREPLGNLCVVRHESLNHWDVLICRGVSAEREVLGSFTTRSEAEMFADAELARLNTAGQPKRYVLHVDDCPCWQKQL